jgi:putative DNA primase/helicase
VTLETLLSKLGRVRREGSQWKALCPAHSDKNPSLSIRQSEERILLYCHAGCPTEAVLAALGMKARDLYGDGTAAQRIVAEYDYCDEKGELLFQVVRLEPKDFRQRRPDSKGGWTWRLNDTRRVLYCLPDLILARSVVICEGEKDCETARGMGLVATCNPHGAGKWRSEYSESLRGKRVCIIADADQPGRKHARDVAASLYCKTESLKIIETPNAKDLSEWVAKGGVRDTLLELIRNASEWKPTTLVENGFTLLPLSDLLARPDVPIDYIVENLLVAGTVSCIVAKPKVGKSTFARNLCLRVSRGEDFLGLSTKQGECIYLALEEREEDIKNDFRAMGAIGIEPILVHAAAAPAEGIARLCELVRERRPVVVVIDPLFRMARIRDEKAYAEVYTALGPLIDVAREAGTHVVLTHHAGKAAKADAIDAPLGSTAIGGAVCTLIHLKRTDSIRSIQTVQRIAQDLPETVLEFDSETHTLALGVPKLDALVQTVATEIEEFLRAGDAAKCEPEIMEAVEGKTGVKRKALRQLVEAGRVQREGSGRRGDPFRYRFSFSCSPYMPGTRKQETENWPDSSINTGDILVPDIVAQPRGGDDSGEQAFLEGKL